MSFKVLITDGLEKEGKTILNARGEVADKKGIEPAELLEVIGEYDALIVRGRTKVTKEVFDAAKNLKVVGRAGVGVDNIDLEAARAHGVTVVNAPTSTTIAVAELAFGLILSLVREIPRADAAMKQEQYPKKDFMGSEVNGKTLGIVGYGNIGRKLSIYAQALGMKVICYDIFFDLSGDLSKVRATGAEPMTLEAVYAQSDIISFHLPLNAQSKHMLNESAFAKMKDGVLIVDAARGGVIDEPALLSALESGKVSGAALDVLEKEPPLDWTLVKHPKVIATPHIGAQTNEAQVRVAIDIAEEVMNILEGNSPRWKIV
ncbi:MAG: hydroxyacid dehydrogenase [Anaerolineaceae bacterium]